MKLSIAAYLEVKYPFSLKSTSLSQDIKVSFLIFGNLARSHVDSLIMIFSAVNRSNQMKKNIAKTLSVLLSGITIPVLLNPVSASESYIDNLPIVHEYISPLSAELKSQSRIAQANSTQEIFNAYFNAGYGYCDAQMLGAFWGTTPASAKLLAGKGLLGWQGFARNIPSKLSAARREYTGRGICNYTSDFSYDDAAALATYWNVPIAQAKDSLTSKLESGNFRLAKRVVSEARQSTSQGNRRPSSRTPSYRLQTIFTGNKNCLDIINDGRNNQLTMAECGNFSGQNWKILPSKKAGYSRLQTMFTGRARCLDIINDGQNNQLTMANCGDFSGQYWKILPSQKTGYSRLQTMFTGGNKCLDIINDGQNNQVTMANCGDFSGQYWKVTKIQ